MSSPWPKASQLISNPSESHQVNIIACAAITWSIGAIFVSLRFYTRGYLLQNVLGMEDWFILVALVFSGATSAGMIEQAMAGLGKHILDVDTSLMQSMARAGWYAILWYLLALLFTKISIALLYIRILSYQHARYAAYTILAVIILTNGVWTFATVVTACIPLKAFWEGNVAGAAYCHSLQIWFANTGLHISTDVLLYVLPLPVIINLRIRARQKVFLYSIFGLGFLVCTISVVRLWDLIEENNRPDFTYDNVSIAYLTCIEVNAAIACACCMTLKPLMVRLFPRLWGSRSDSGGMRRGMNKNDLEALAHVGSSDIRSGNDKRGLPTIGSKPSRVRRAGPGMMGGSSWGLSTRFNTFTCVSHGKDEEDEKGMSICTTRGGKSVDDAGGSDSSKRGSEDKGSGGSLWHGEGITPMPESPSAAKLRAG